MFKISTMIMTIFLIAMNAKSETLVCTPFSDQNFTILIYDFDQAYCRSKSNPTQNKHLQIFGVGLGLRKGMGSTTMNVYPQVFHIVCSGDEDISGEFVGLKADAGFAFSAAGAIYGSTKRVCVLGDVSFDTGGLELSLSYLRIINLR